MSHNTVIHRIVRVAVRPLAETPVTPNQVTTLRLCAGLAAAAAFAAGTEYWRQVGAGLFLVSLVLDRADGELARVSGKTSPWGHKYDLISDALCNALAFIGLGIGLTGSVYGLWAPVMGVGAGLAVAAILWLVIAIESQRGPRAGELGSAVGFDPDDGMFAVPLALWLGLAEELLAAAAVGAPAFALFMFVRLREAARG